MADILALVAIVLAIIAMNRNRRNSAQLADEIQELRRQLAALGAGVAPRQAGPEATAGEADDEAVGAASAPAEPAVPGPWTRAGERQAAAAQATTGEGDPAAAAMAAAAPEAVRESLESRIGGRWAVWVGGLALALGGIFMVRYAIESGLLSPGVRLTLAALFGLTLVAAGEIVRRRAQPLVAAVFRNAMIPGVLTAAGTLTLFGVTYAAYAVYGYLGASAAFVLLAAIALATIELALLHGQALAGLGLLASMVTPLLVSTAEPDPWRLFGYLSVAWLATLVAARQRRWLAVPTLANAGLGLWALLYLAATDAVQSLPVTLALLVMLAGIALVWPGRGIGPAATAPVGSGVAAGAAEGSGAGAGGAEVGAPAPVNPAVAQVAALRWLRLLAPPAVAVSLSAALAAAVPAIALAFAHPAPASAAPAFAVLALALAAVGAGRAWAIHPALFGHLCALSGAMVLAGLSGGLAVDVLVALPQAPSFDTAAPAPAPGTAPVNLLLLLSAGLAVVGAAGIRLWKDRAPGHAALLGVLMATVPVAIAAAGLFAFGHLSLDLRHGLFALVLGLAYLGAAEVNARGLPAGAAPVPQWALLAGAFAFLVLSLVALTNGLATTLLVALLGFAMAMATRLRPWPALPWLMVGAAIVVAVRIGWEPTVVGAANLSSTPVFNALLAGYGGPALLLAAAAYELRRWPGERVRNLLQALASLFVLLAVAILVRHAMNGGVLDSTVPSLGEQAIYTLLAVGGSAVFMTLDLRSPSPVFRYGSMLVGVLSVLSILLVHFVALNPYVTGELTGRWPFFNLLLIGYLLPGAAFAGLAWYARDKRPPAYVTLLALTGAALVIAWLSLSVRRYWHGEGIAAWKGFLQGETYTYSVVWLLLGVALLALGSRLDAKSLRLASAALVLIAVVKVFVFDMANLEGILRALSFIGLGVVLIGIGLFYQRILSAAAGGRGAPPAA